MSMTHCDICGREWKFHGTACSDSGELLAPAPGSATERRAAKISNDIAEGIDCGESRQTLRSVLNHFAIESSVKSSEISLLKTEVLAARFVLAALAKSCRDRLPDGHRMKIGGELALAERLLSQNNGGQP